MQLNDNDNDIDQGWDRYIAKSYIWAVGFLLSPILLLLVGWVINLVFIAARSHSLPEFIWWVIVVGLAASGAFLLVFLAYRMLLFVTDLLDWQGTSLLLYFLPVGFFVVLLLAWLIAPSIAISSFQAECPQSIQDSASGKNYSVPLLSVRQEPNGISFVDPPVGDRIYLSNYRQSGDNLLECVRDRFNR